MAPLGVPALRAEGLTDELAVARQDEDGRRRIVNGPLPAIDFGEQPRLPARAEPLKLEFTVEACIEPFAAVKKLMSQHFDAVVVDCDNEQNATLLFKSARNSSSNQTSLAVAAVEGQPGVAKAFRIGANLVLTKPINIEQAKGTLRVARGLLRKSEPGKSAAAAPPKPIATKPVPDAKPAAPAATLTAASNAADLSRAREAANASVPIATLSDHPNGYNCRSHCRLRSATWKAAKVMP